MGVDELSAVLDDDATAEIKGNIVSELSGVVGRNGGFGCDDDFFVSGGNRIPAPVSRIIPVTGSGEDVEGLVARGEADVAVDGVAAARRKDIPFVFSNPRVGESKVCGLD